MTVIVAAASLDDARTEAKTCQVVTKTKCHRIKRVVLAEYPN